MESHCHTHEAGVGPAETEGERVVQLTQSCSAKQGHGVPGITIGVQDYAFRECEKFCVFKE